MDLAGIRHLIIFILISVGLHCSGLLLNKTFESQRPLNQQIGVVLLRESREGFFPSPEVKVQAAAVPQSPLRPVIKKDASAAAATVKKAEKSVHREDIITAAAKPAVPARVAQPEKSMAASLAKTPRPEAVAVPIQQSAKSVAISRATTITKVVPLVQPQSDWAGEAGEEQTAAPLHHGEAALRQEAGRSAPEENQTLFQLAVPLYVGNPKPEYPKIARLRGWEGTVRLDVVVRKDGRVGKVELADSSGFRSLDQVALKTVYRWRFRPAMNLGTPVESKVQVPVRFVLNAQP